MHYPIHPRPVLLKLQTGSFKEIRMLMQDGHLIHITCTDFDYGSYHLIELTAGVTGRQGMRTLPMQPIPLLIHLVVRVCHSL
jgi:hypothetical protein